MIRKTKKGCLFWKQPFLEKEKKMKKLIFVMLIINKSNWRANFFFQNHKNHKLPILFNFFIIFSFIFSLSEFFIGFLSSFYPIKVQNFEL